MPSAVNGLVKMTIFLVAGYATFQFLGQRPSTWCGSLPTEEVLFTAVAATTALIAGAAGTYRIGGSTYNKINTLMLSAFIFVAANFAANYYFALGLLADCR